MCKSLLLLLCIAILSESHAILVSNPSAETGEEDIAIEDWSEAEPPYTQLSLDPYSDNLRIVRKRSGSDNPMRRSSLDKNFMRFGRSGFFPSENCCRQRDLIGFTGSWQSSGDAISVRKRSGDDNFMRFGREMKDNFIRFGRPDTQNSGRLDKDNFMRFGKAGTDNFMRFGKGDKDSFMRFGKGNSNFMRFGRGDKDNFMRFGRGDKDNFMRFGRGDKDNFMRFGKSDKDNFMRFGKGDNFIRFGRGDKDNFMRFGRGDKDNFMRFGKSDEYFHYPESSSEVDNSGEDFFRGTRSENFIRFGKNLKNHSNFVRYGKSGGRDDSFIRFGKNGRNGSNFLRFGRDPSDADKEPDDGNVDVDGEATKTTPVIRRKRSTDSTMTRQTRNPEVVDEGQTQSEDAKRSPVEANVSRPNLLKFISLINSNRPDAGSIWETDSLRSYLDKSKRRQDGNGFIRFG